MDSASDSGSDYTYDSGSHRNYTPSPQRNRKSTRNQLNKSKWDILSSKKSIKKSRNGPAGKTLRSDSFNAYDSPQIENCPETNQTKTYKSGRVTRNPFLNFLRVFRAQNAAKSILDVAKAAGAAWRKMSKGEREPYYKLACQAPKKKINRRTKCSKCGYKAVRSRNIEESKKRTRSCRPRRNRH